MLFELNSVFRQDSQKITNRKQKSKKEKAKIKSQTHRGGSASAPGPLPPSSLLRSGLSVVIFLPQGPTGVDLISDPFWETGEGGVKRFCPFGTGFSATAPQHAGVQGSSKARQVKCTAVLIKMFPEKKRLSEVTRACTSSVWGWNQMKLSRCWKRLSAAGKRRLLNVVFPF